MMGLSESLHEMLKEAQEKGFATSDLVVSHLSAKRASRPLRAGRHVRRKAKRTHVEIVVEQRAVKEKAPKKSKEERAKRTKPKEEKPAEAKPKQETKAEPEETEQKKTPVKQKPSPKKKEEKKE